MGIKDVVRRFASREPEPSPDERPDPEGRFYRLDELSQVGQGDRDVQSAYSAEIVGFTVYRDYEAHNQSDMAFAQSIEDAGGPRTVKAVFDDFESTFVKTSGDGWEPIRKSDLPLPVLEQAVKDGYAKDSDLDAARRRVVAERGQRVEEARATLEAEGFTVQLPELDPLDSSPAIAPAAPRDHDGHRLGS